MTCHWKRSPMINSMDEKRSILWYIKKLQNAGNKDKILTASKEKQTGHTQVSRIKMTNDFSTASAEFGRHWCSAVTLRTMISSLDVNTQSVSIECMDRTEPCWVTPMNQNNLLFIHFSQEAFERGRPTKWGHKLKGRQRTQEMGYLTWERKSNQHRLAQNREIQEECL